MKYVNIDGNKHPVKWNPRAKSAWEGRTGITWQSVFPVMGADGEVVTEGHKLTVEESMIILHEALREGARRDGVKKFHMTLNDIFDYADDFDLEAQVTSVVFNLGSTKSKGGKK